MTQNSQESRAESPEPGAASNSKSLSSQLSAQDSSGGMHVKIYSPFKVYFDEAAQSISAMNDTGPFDILGGHHNFMTLLSPCDIVIRAARGEEKIRIARGIMHVKADQVIVFLDV